jgi:uncharacterized protein YigA (DUF484 family)
MQEHSSANDLDLNDGLISDFLRQNPLFFERNAHLLTELYLPSPHGNGAISLAERQQLAQRDKIRVTENMLAELIENAKQNDVTTQKIHQLSIALMSHPRLSQIVEIVSRSMVEIFNVDYAHFYCWLHAEAEALSEMPIFSPVPDVLSEWVSALEEPYCGAKPTQAQIPLENAQGSFAFVPLYAHTPKAVEESPSHLPAIGVLILASKDAEHFKPNMGTVFLSRIGDLLSVAIANARA